MECYILFISGCTQPPATHLWLCLHLQRVSSGSSSGRTRTGPAMKCKRSSTTLQRNMTQKTKLRYLKMFPSQQISFGTDLAQINLWSVTQIRVCWCSSQNWSRTVILIRVCLGKGCCCKERAKRIILMEITCIKIVASHIFSNTPMGIQGKMEKKERKTTSIVE